MPLPHIADRAARTLPCPEVCRLVQRVGPGEGIQPLLVGGAGPRQAGHFHILPAVGPEQYSARLRLTRTGRRGTVERLSDRVVNEDARVHPRSVPQSKHPAIDGTSWSGSSRVAPWSILIVRRDGRTSPPAHSNAMAAASPAARMGDATP